MQEIQNPSSIKLKQPVTNHSRTHVWTKCSM